jgi:hypothetical protein
MDKSHTYSRFAYFDTNVLSELAKKPERWRSVQEYLFREDLTLAVASQVAELSDASRLHKALCTMLLAMPSAIIKVHDQVLREEVEAHRVTVSYFEH